jgi:general secretion pathway protein I
MGSVDAPIKRGLFASPTTTKRGFSLLEVMVAIAILGLTLTVILSAQGGLAASNRSAANMGTAVSLGRCKMTELEEKLLKLGFQETDQIETATPCCDDQQDEAFKCDFKVEKIELPNMNTGNSLDEGGALLGATSPSSLPGMLNPAGSAGLDLSGDGGLQALGGSLASQFGVGMPGAPGSGMSAVGGAGAQGLLGMVMGIIYPSLKPMYEMSIRRVTVSVKWKEGPNERELPLVQFVTNPQRAGFAGSALLPDGAPMDFAAPTGSGAPSGATPGGGAAPRSGGGASSGGGR